MNQAVKAVAVAIGFVAQRGYVMSTRPSFETVNIRGEDTTAIVFHVDVVR